MIEIFNDFIDFCGVYFAVGSMVLLAATIIYTTLPIKRYKPEILSVRFVCYLCKGDGEARNDPEFDCYLCKGTGIISFPIRVGHSFFDDFSSRLAFLASLSEYQQKRFIGFQPTTNYKA